MHTDALKELLYKIADDQLILGHRNSEWTGMGPLLEEDIAFSSMAQDKIGQSFALYSMLEALGEGNPDRLAFMRKASAFMNCVFVEIPNGEYDFSLIRHFLYDTAAALRFRLLCNSTYQPLSDLSRKVTAEMKYHTLHANTWIKQLGRATEESVSRLQTALDLAAPYANGMFEPSPFEAELINEKIFVGEKTLEQQWRETVSAVLAETQLRAPDWNSVNSITGGRRGQHSEHLQPLLDEMSEVFRIDPTAEW